MRQFIAGISRSIRRFLRNNGINISPTYLSPSLQGFIHRLRDQNFEISIVYDIGAYKGNWTRAVKKHLGYSPKFFLFEPNSAHNEDLDKEGNLTLMSCYLIKKRRGLFIKRMGLEIRCILRAISLQETMFPWNFSPARWTILLSPMASLSLI